MISCKGLVMEAIGGRTMSRTTVLTLMRGPALFGLFCAILCGSTARGDEARLSISGYDPVAYFTDGKPVPGKPDLEYLWHKLRWRFASSEHRDLFSKDPEHYAPQYDGYCAMGAAGDAAAHKDTVDPEAWAIVDGKLYLVHNSYWLSKWQEQAKDYIKRADASWQVVADLPAPTIVGPPCAASPPTTAVALRGGGHWLIVGGQEARDGAGNVVGKGDMPAQIEQVGKNVMRASAPAAQPSTTSSLRSTTSLRPPNSTNTPICYRAILGRRRLRARWSRRRNCPARTFC
jgi:hypothetical protein